MIPRAYLQAWSARAPWPDLRQVEQDLIISRALCDLLNSAALRHKIAFRGGAAILRQRRYPNLFADRSAGLPRGSA